MAKDDSPAAGKDLESTGSSPDYDEAIQASERQSRSEFGPLPIGMIATTLTPDRPSTYLVANDTFCRLTGYSHAELTGADLLGCVHPDEQSDLESAINSVISGVKDRICTETRLISKDGEIIHVRLTGSVIAPFHGDRRLVTYAEDISAAMRAQDELRRLERELRRLRRLDSLGQLADGITHDFNNMLTVITNFASLVRDEVIIAEATEGASRWGPVRWDVEQIEDAADRAKRLIRHLLAFARREQAEPAPVDTGTLISDATTLLREVLGEHIEIVTRLGAGIWPVGADAGLLEQSIVNLALNARDAMPGGGQVVIETANIDATAPGRSRENPADLAELLPGHYVAIRVIDTGTGMDQATADRAFEPFFTTKPAQQAAGLGLSSVRRIASQGSGNAWLRSEPGYGTTVTMVLPAMARSPAPWPVGGQPGEIARNAGAILVVDDEAGIRDVAHRILTWAGYQVTTAGSGHEAITVLTDQKKPVDLLLTDVVMPGLTGEPLAARARTLRPGIRILFMSGYERRAAHAPHWPHPARHVIAKPFSRAALLAQVSEALGTDSRTSGAARALH
jgi:hypothetical protein